MASRTVGSGRIDPADHADPDWHIHEIAGDFDLIDAWKLPVAGEYHEFLELTELFVSLDFTDDEGSKVNNLLFATRLKLGEIFGWDKEVLTQPIPGCEESSLRDRLPPELRPPASENDREEGGSTTEFQLVYQTETESLLELSNSTVHAAVHFAWIPAGDASYFGQMGIYVKNRGRLGHLYMPAIAPFRHYIVYPALMRRLGQAWQQRASGQ